MKELTIFGTTSDSSQSASYLPAYTKCCLFRELSQNPLRQPKFISYRLQDNWNPPLALLDGGLAFSALFRLNGVAQQALAIGEVKQKQNISRTDYGFVQRGNACFIDLRQGLHLKQPWNEEY